MVNGVLAINKPMGFSSSDIDNKIKSHLAQLLGVTKSKAPKVGHGGTLDPFATGLLHIGIGSSTKDLHHLEQSSKQYFATIVLGQKTDTDDLTGKITESNDVSHITDDLIRQKVEEHFIGEILQKPPSFSAKKIGGKRAYKMAREGEDFTLKSNLVEIYNFHIFQISRVDGIINVMAFIDVSKGTFIRSIARDLGNLLGVGGHLSALERTCVDNKYLLKDAFNLEDVLATNTVEDFAKLLNKYPHGSVITLGSFDGFHTGHQALVDKVVKKADELHAKSIVFIVDKISNQFERITTYKYKKRLIQSKGVDEVYFIDIQKVRNMEYQDFINYLSTNFKLRHLVLTKNMRFGKDQKGDYQNIIHYIDQRNTKIGFNKIEYSDVDLARDDADIVSSTRIREALKRGQVNLAGKLLGRKYRVSGIVVKGYERGKSLGFPTANISNIKTTVPGDGVYFGCLEYDRKRFPAMISVGNNPTFKNQKRSVEVHVPRRNDLELYDKYVTVSFGQRICNMQAFDNIETLKRRLKYLSNLTVTAYEINNGRLAVIPTDTVYGIVAQYGNEGLKNKIYQIKNRDRNKPLQILVDGVGMARKIEDFGERAVEVANDFWPGPTTIVVGNHGFRMPNSPFVRSVLKLTGALWATSLNVSNEPPIADLNKAKDLFGNDISVFVKDASNSITPNSKSSRVLKVDGDNVELLRS